MKKVVTALMKDTTAATAAEYAIILALIAVVIIVAVAAFGQEVNSLFTRPDLNKALS